ncbi:MAG: hypothetical protein IPJ74_13105 [Saprospiraceae bacterium]|nr:hypothetical protein [Saprospiraceae bacterium]
MLSNEDHLHHIYSANPESLEIEIQIIIWIYPKISARPLYCNAGNPAIAPLAKLKSEG